MLDDRDKAKNSKQHIKLFEELIKQHYNKGLSFWQLPSTWLWPQKVTKYVNLEDSPRLGEAKQSSPELESVENGPNPSPDASSESEEPENRIEQQKEGYESRRKRCRIF